MKLIRTILQRVKNQRGVTLIELLAVIVILGIIAAIGIPAIVDSRDEAEEATFQANAKLLSDTAKKRMLFHETYNADAVVTNTTDTEFSLKELATEIGIETNVGDEADNKLPQKSNDTQIGIYEIDPTTGNVTYTKQEAAPEV